jgi:ABC-type uncharacterized transport system fused permease/ATPase subunit
VNNIRATLAIVWRIATPYFRSEDKWAGRGLLAAVVTIELLLVGNDVLLNQWRNRFYNALQEKDWNSFVHETFFFITTECSCRATPPTTRTSACPTTSSCSSSAHSTSASAC